MHFSTIITALTALSFTGASPAFSPLDRQSAPVKAAVRSRDGIVPESTILKPVKLGLLTKRGGEGKRDRDFSGLDLQQMVHMLYGAPSVGGSTAFLANMKLHAPRSDTPLVMMEHFEPYTTSIDCSTPGKISLAFKDKNALNYALSKWAWVNGKTHQFIMIANHRGCGPDGQRVPYVIHHIHPDEPRRTLDLDVTEGEWGTVANTFDMNFGHVSSSELQKRGFLDDIVNGLESAADTVSNAVSGALDSIAQAIDDLGTGSVSPDKTWSLDTGDAGKDLPLYDSDSVTVKCTDCNVRGSIHLVGQLSVESWSVTAASLTVQPQSVSATAILGVTIKESQDILNYNKTIPVESPVGINIPGIFSIGANPEVVIGGKLTLGGEADIGFGITASIPNTALINADLIQQQSGITGFDSTQVQLTQPTLNNLSFDLIAAAYISPKISLGINILNGKFVVGAAFIFDTPIVETDFKFGTSDTAFCPDQDQSITSGFKISTTATFDCKFQVQIGTQPQVNQVLFKHAFELLDEICYPFPQ